MAGSYASTGTEIHSRAAAVTAAAALTAPASFNATFSATEANALRADVLALQAKLNALLVSLRAGNVISS